MRFCRCFWWYSRRLLFRTSKKNRTYFFILSLKLEFHWIERWMANKLALISSRPFPAYKKFPIRLCCCLLLVGENETMYYRVIQSTWAWFRFKGNPRESMCKIRINFFFAGPLDAKGMHTISMWPSSSSLNFNSGEMSRALEGAQFILLKHHKLNEFSCITIVVNRISPKSTPNMLSK